MYFADKALLPEDDEGLDFTWALQDCGEHLSLIPTDGNSVICNRL
jgi:hypothetical protein